MFLPIAAILFITHTARAYPDVSCVQHLGPVDPAEAEAALEHIPVLELDMEATPAANGGRMTINIPSAAHLVRPPVVFHSGRAIIDIEEIAFPRSEQEPGGLSRTEESFYLWAAARTGALRIMARCVYPTNGARGGRARFSVGPPGQPAR